MHGGGGIYVHFEASCNSMMVLVIGICKEASLQDVGLLQLLLNKHAAKPHALSNKKGKMASITT